MSYSDPRHCHHQRVTQWLAAIRQHAAWLYAADEQYLYLVAQAIRYQGEPSEAFRWYAVSRDVGNVRNQGAHLIEPQRSAS
ncbi:TPA: hypothetical protein L5E06_004892 [Pseudomonas aeruginosa]|nr:hypothetical protein [Pseudomonas aeruginosa]